MANGPNFLINPGGSGGGGTKPRDFLQHRTTRPGPDPSFNADSVPEGGTIPNTDPRGDDKGNPIGTYADRAAKPPFRVGG